MDAKHGPRSIRALVPKLLRFFVFAYIVRGLRYLENFQKIDFFVLYHSRPSETCAKKFKVDPSLGSRVIAPNLTKPGQT